MRDLAIKVRLSLTWHAHKPINAPYFSVFDEFDSVHCPVQAGCICDSRQRSARTASESCDARVFGSEHPYDTPHYLMHARTQLWVGPVHAWPT